MKKTILKIIPFIAIFVVLWVSLAAMVLSVARYQKDGASVICEAKRKFVRHGGVVWQRKQLNVLFMGNSKILSGIIPRTFDSVLNGKTNSFNLALPALPIAPNYFELRDYLKHSPAPEWVILYVSVNNGSKPDQWFDYYALQGISFPDELVSYLLNRKDKTVILNYFTPFQVYKNVLSQALISKKSGEFGRNAKDIALAMLHDNGYYFIKEQAVFPDFRLPDTFGLNIPPISISQVDIDNDPYVSRFFSLCQERRIKVLLIEPAQRRGSVLDCYSLPVHYRTLLRRYKNVVMAPGGYYPPLLENKYFSDKSHLNPDGAEIYTKLIAEEFQQAMNGECQNY